MTERINPTEDMKTRFDKVKESLDQEYLQYTKLSSGTTDYQALIKLQKTHNLIRFQNAKKIKLIQELKNSISMLEKTDSKNNSTRTVSNLSSKLPGLTSISERPEICISDIKDQIKNTEDEIEKENFLKDQLEQMKIKQKAEILILSKKILEIQEFYKSITKYQSNVEEAKTKADNKEIQVYDNYVTLKKNILKHRKSRKKILFGFKKIENGLSRSLNWVEKKVVESTLAQEDTKVKREAMLKGLEKALSLYDHNKSIHMNSINELNYYFLNIEKIKQILKNSECMSIPEAILENIALTDIYRIFHQIQSMEVYLQTNYSNLSLTHCLLEENIVKLQSELEDIKNQECISGQIDSIKQSASNLKIEDSTYSGLRINLDAKSNNNEELISFNENLSVFILRFILEISHRIQVQLSFIKKSTENHPNYLQLYLTHVSGILVELQNGHTVKLKNKKKKSTITLDNHLRRKTIHKTTPLPPEDSDYNPYSRLEFEKFKAHTESQLSNIFLSHFSGSKLSKTFSSVLSFNTLCKHFISKNDLISYLQDSHDQDPTGTLAISNIYKLFNIAHKNLKKIAEISTEIVLEILKKVKFSIVELQNFISAQDTSKIIKKISNSKLDQKKIPPEDLIKYIFGHKLNVIFEKKQEENIKEEFNNFIKRFSLSAAIYKESESNNDLNLQKNERIGEQNTNRKAQKT